MNLILLFIIELIAVIAVKSNPILKIANGTIEGIFMESRKGRKIAAFMGIPYALPPLGDLRFEPPKPASSWNQVLSVKTHSKMCTQRDIYMNQKDVVGDEDCLYLNVYTPQLNSPEESQHYKNYPVMIWFHGGGFIAGAGNSDAFGPKFLMDHEVILVTFNYRLGPLGFLSTGDLIIPGNQGMKDQAQAIRWVYENIAEFGGDRHKITLFGHSAGSASVHYHMISPLSKGLFQRAISQSGSVMCPWAFNTPEKAKKNAKQLGKILKCPTKNSTQLLHCLRNKSHIDITATDRDFQIFDYCPIVPFRPVLEPNHLGAFLKEDPNILLKNGEIIDIPWLSGITSHEGAFRVSRLRGINNGEFLKKLDEDFETIAPITFLYEDKYPTHMHKKLSKSIRKFYFDNQSLNQSTNRLMEVYSDSWMLFPQYYSLIQHLKFLSSSSYFYHFAYRGTATFSKLLGDKVTNYGVCHGDELQYLFPIGELLFQDTPMNDEDHKMIDLMTSLWINFVNFGNPTPEVTSKIPVKWEPIRTHSLEYLHIKNPSEFFMDKNLGADRVQFWKNLFPYEEDSILSANQVSKDEL